MLGAASVFAQDWPQWRGPNRDGKVAGFTVPQTWLKTLTQKWKTTVGLGDATPALAGDKLYVFARQSGDEVAMCLDASRGKELWRDEYATPAPGGSSGSHPGPRGSPAVAEGRIVTLGVNGVLSCLHTANGKVAWRNHQIKDVPEWFTGMSPMIVDGVAIAHLGGTGKGAVISFDLATGREKWKWSGDPPTYSSPVLMTVEGMKQVVVQGEANIQGLALADGKLLWQIALPAKGKSLSTATPIIDGQTLIYSWWNSGIRAVKIEKQGDGFAVKELWTNGRLGMGMATPVLNSGLLYGLSERRKFYCLSVRTGDEAWSHAAGRDQFGAIVDVGPVLLALLCNSELIVFRPSDSRYEELARIKVAKSPTYAHPVVAGKRIFVKDEDAVTLWMFE
jgi:outer membrane protein assembly factor BamB